MSEISGKLSSESKKYKWGAKQLSLMVSLDDHINDNGLCVNMVLGHVQAVSSAGGCCRTRVGDSARVMVPIISIGFSLPFCFVLFVTNEIIVNS